MMTTPQKQTNMKQMQHKNTANKENAAVYSFIADYFVEANAKRYTKIACSGNTEALQQHSI